MHPTDIEAELEQIWKTLQGTNKMRACLFNLIVYAKKNQKVTYLSHILRKVIEKFPSRILFVVHDDTSSHHQLHTKASVMTADEGEYEVACDLIEIDVSYTDHLRIPFVILPHLLPDLPIYLLHADDPSFESSVAPLLEHLADRIIFDSEGVASLPLFARAVLAHHARCDADVADLNWARIEGWRQLLASVFQTQDELDRLKKACKMTLRYSEPPLSPPQGATQSIYLQAWLAVQLGWTLREETHALPSSSFFYQSTYGPLHIELLPTHVDHLPPGRIVSITIETMEQDRYDFHRRSTCPHHVIIEKSSPQFCAVPVNYILERDFSGQSLVKEICHQGTSHHYLKMLELLTTMDQRRP